MASLTNTKIKDTYDGLLKTTDNDALGGTYKLITDGLGNSSGVYLGTGGNVGIGQSSPTTYKLDVNGTFRAVSTAYFESGINAASYIYHSGDTNTFFGFPANDTFTVTTNNAERMRIDSGGNVGIGTTDPAELLTVSASDDVSIRINSTKDTAWTTNQKLGAFEFFGNDSSSSGPGLKGYVNLTSVNQFGAAFNMNFGVGDNATDRMVITYDGNVGIGTTDPESKLQIQDDTTNCFVRVRAGTSSIAGIEFGDSDDIDIAGIRYSNFSNNMRFNVNGSERMRIDSSGNVGIGTTPGTFKLDVAGSARSDFFALRTNQSLPSESSAIYRPATGTFAIVTATVERMRITSAGRIHFYNLLGSSATQSDVRYDTTSKEMFYNTSSERYKTEIVDLENTLDKVNSLRAVRYKDIETEQETTGLIAEEVIEIIPEVVFKKEIEGFDEPQPEGINYSDFAPFLIKAIQELKAEIETLKSQINS